MYFGDTNWMGKVDIVKSSMLQYFSTTLHLWLV